MRFAPAQTVRIRVRHIGNVRMSDLIDQAQHYEAINLAQSLQAHRRRAETESRPAARGHCLNRECLEPFEPAASSRLFCGPACAEAHQRQMGLARHRSGP